MIIRNLTLDEAYAAYSPTVDQIIVDENGNVTVKTDADRDVVDPPQNS